MKSTRWHITPRAYWFAWVALVALTMLSLGLSLVPLGAVEMIAALGIAAVKALVVSLVFMHLAEHSFGYRFVLLVGILFVVIMMGLTVLDILTRADVDLAPPLRG